MKSKRNGRFGPDENPSGQRWQIGMHQHEQEADIKSLHDVKPLVNPANLTVSEVAK